MDEDLGFRIEIRSIETSERTSLELRLGRSKKAIKNFINKLIVMS